MFSRGQGSGSGLGGVENLYRVLVLPSGGCPARGLGPEGESGGGGLWGL